VFFIGKIEKHLSRKKFTTTGSVGMVVKASTSQFEDMHSIPSSSLTKSPRCILWQDSTTTITNRT